jgi:RHS repeat-associated protein
MQTAVSQRLACFKASLGAESPLPRFSRKELDAETGFYYYGARYLNPKTSMWISADPAMGDYIPSAPVDDEAKKHNENLPGMGGVYNYVNMHVYHYAGNNPVKYVDPDGNWFGADDALAGPVDEIAVLGILFILSKLGNKWASEKLDGIENFFDNTFLSESADEEDFAIPTPEELEQKTKERQKEIENAPTGTLSAPEYPEDHLPELPKTLLGAIIDVIGDILGYLDN